MPASDFMDCLIYEIAMNRKANEPSGGLATPAPPQSPEAQLARILAAQQFQNALVNTSEHSRRASDVQYAK